LHKLLKQSPFCPIAALEAVSDAGKLLAAAKNANFPGSRGLSSGTAPAIVGIAQSSPFGMSI
jgi:hypothetical protein